MDALEWHAVRVSRRAAHVRGLVRVAARSGEANRGAPVTPELTADQARRSAEEIAERARLVVEEWVRAELPAESQLVAVAVMALRRTLEGATVEPVPVDAAGSEAGAPSAGGVGDAGG